ncbi:MAG: hypothetical protein R2815_05250 [Flavobacteriales bacterium]|nr:periplasmic heavy metal sensor [Flavobacteriales bacterium]
MKRSIIIAVLATFTAAGANAQEKAHKTPEQHAKDRTERMTKELGLSAEQQAKVEAINLNYAKQAEALRAERRAEREAMKKEGQGKGKEMMEAHRAEMKGVLSTEQYDTWIAKQEAMKEKRMEQRKEMHPARERNMKAPQKQ